MYHLECLGAFYARSFLATQRPKLSDGDHEARRLEQQRNAAVRCSAWLGDVGFGNRKVIASGPLWWWRIK
jgi:hypothetical protein